MANITQILGTDSISSSRPVINSNFQLVNDDIADLQALLDPTNATIQNISSATVAALTVLNGTTNIATFTTTGIDLDVDVEFAARTTMAAEIVKSGVEGSDASPTAASSPNSLAESAYFVNSNFNLPAGIEGQEVTVINVNTSAIAVNIQAIQNLELGATSISLGGKNSTVTLRYIGDVWYVISSHAATIS
jgi:hypothetical protein